MNVWSLVAEVTSTVPDDMSQRLTGVAAAVVRCHGVCCTAAAVVVVHRERRVHRRVSSVCHYLAARPAVHVAAAAGCVCVCVWVSVCVCVCVCVRVRVWASATTQTLLSESMAGRRCSAKSI